MNSEIYDRIKAAHDEIKLAEAKFKYSCNPSIRVIINHMLAKGEMYMNYEKNPAELNVAYDDIFKFVFLNSVVDDDTVQMAMTIARNRVYAFIDRMADGYLENKQMKIFDETGVLPYHGN